MITTAFACDQTDSLPRVPPDVSQCIKLFRASCGPVSLAAVLGTSVLEVMKFFPRFPRVDYTTYADMSYALEMCGADHSKGDSTFPTTGLLLLQLQGRWTRPGVPVPVQLRYTHWIGCRNGFIFDVNVGDWLERHDWISNGAQSWMSGVSGCVGFSVRERITITPKRFEFSPFGRVPTRHTCP